PVSRHADGTRRRAPDELHLGAGVARCADRAHQVGRAVELPCPGTHLLPIHGEVAAERPEGRACGALQPLFSMCSRAARSSVRSKWLRTRVPLASSRSVKVCISLRSAASVSPPSAWI